MSVNASATPRREQLSSPISFRHLRSRVEILDAFRRADGHETMTPILREAVDMYIDTRLRQTRSITRNREGGTAA